MEPIHDVIIVGGSYAGLSAAMALARSLREVLIIDSGQPCNLPTPRAHNFLTHDGALPREISALALQQVLAYPTVSLHKGLAIKGTRTETGFSIETGSGDTFSAKKLLFATGMSDHLPDIRGLSDCWGISALHCPYCHGYEISGKPIGLMGNAELGFELCRLLYQWSNDITLFTHGPEKLDPAHELKIRSYNIGIVENEIEAVVHDNGYIRQILVKDGATFDIQAFFIKPGSVQHCPLPEQLGCALGENGLIHIDELQQTSVPGIFAAGDNTTAFRAISAAVASGGKAGACINKQLIEEKF